MGRRATLRAKRKRAKRASRGQVGYSVWTRRVDLAAAVVIAIGLTLGILVAAALWWPW